jgi:hypothetical protein
MTARPTRETLESLRVTLQKLEQTADPASNGQDVLELKQILLNRIAELETLNALERQPDAEAASAPSDLPPLPVVTEEDAIAETAGSSSLEKLD